MSGRACLLRNKTNGVITVNVFMIHHTGQRMLTTPTVSSSGRIPAFLWITECVVGGPPSAFVAFISCSGIRPGLPFADHDLGMATVEILPPSDHSKFLCTQICSGQTPLCVLSLSRLLSAGQSAATAFEESDVER